MNYEELKNNIAKIVEVTSSVPEPLRETCFEILLMHLLSEMQGPAAQTSKTPSPQQDTPTTAITPSPESVPMPAQVRVFMTRHAVSQEILQAILMHADKEIHFIREPSPSSVAEGQIQWALLLSLKNGILSNSFIVDPEDVRSICQQKGFYDSANFAAIFRRPANAKLFKGILQPQGDTQQLSQDGEAELASLLKSLAGKAS